MDLTQDTAPLFLRALFDRAVAVADPMQVLPAHLPPRPPGRVVVVGAGKAAARMAEAVTRHWGACEGLVITRYGHARPAPGVTVVEAGHPTPDAAGEAATRQMMALLAGCGADDFVLALVSGGASALLVAPAPGVTLAEKAALSAALMAGGGSIDQINRLRGQISAVKHGRMAALAHPARVLGLVMSDVPGDDLAVVGSGPFVPPNEDPAAARAASRALLAGLGLPLPAPLRAEGPATPFPADLRLENRLIAAPAASLRAASRMARAAGVRVIDLGPDVEGEAQAVAQAHAAQARRLQASLAPADAPALILSGGELTVTGATGPGVGGPNAEYALALAVALRGRGGIYALACDTDGVDGAAEVAGATIAPDTLARAAGAGIDPVASLRAHDAHGFFATVGGQVITGPTLTNVNDFRAILVFPAEPAGSETNRQG